MDYEKVYKYLGWKPKMDFGIGLKDTVEWYRNYLSSENSF